MTLRAKFSLLLAVMAVAIVAIVGTAIGAFALLSQTLESPFRDAVRSLSALHELDLALQQRRELLRSGAAKSDATAAVVKLRRLAKRANDAVETLQAVEAGDAGQGFDDALITSLPQKVQTLFQLSEATLRTGEAPAARIEQTDAELTQFVQRLRARVDEQSQAAAEFSASLRAALLLALALELLAAAVIGYLVLRYLDKWIVTPVGQLREAARRLGEGDFTHRVPVEGKDEVAALGAEVNRMAGLVLEMQEARARQAKLAALGEMSRAVAHNIRNPLAGIRALAELTRAELNGDTELADRQSRIIDTVDRFDGWLREMLRSTSSQPTPLVEVAPWLEAVVKARQSSANTRQVRIVLDAADAPAKARFDPARLEHVLESLLTNALDASPPGGEVRCVAGQDGSVWWIRVEDDGPGVPEHVRDRIFEHGFTTKASGSGVGLAMALQIVRAHGGDLQLDPPGAPERTRGAAFTIRLPVNGPSPQRDAREQDGAAGSA